MTDDAKPMDRYQRWRLANPEKVRDQRERKRLRAKGLLPPYVRPPSEHTPEIQKSRMKDWHKRLKEDPEKYEKYKEDQRDRSKNYYLRLKSDPVAYRAMLDKNRNAKRLAKGIPLDEPIGFRAERKPKKEKKKGKKVKPVDQERARRAAEIEVAKAAQAAAIIVEPAPCPDPPELQELFRKASKGEPPRPFPAAGRRRSVFHLRGAY